MRANIPFYKASISGNNGVVTQANRLAESQAPVRDAVTTTTSTATTSTAPASGGAMPQIQSTPVVVKEDKLLNVYTSHPCNRGIYDNIHLIVQKLNEGATWKEISDCLRVMGIKTYSSALIEIVASVTTYGYLKVKGEDCDIGNTIIRRTKSYQQILDKKRISGKRFCTFLRIIMVEYKKCNPIAYETLGTRGVQGPSYKAAMSELRVLYKQYKAFSGSIYDFVPTILLDDLKTIVDKARMGQEEITPDGPDTR